VLHQSLADLAAAAHDEVEGAGGQAAAVEDLGQRPAAGGHQLGRLEHHGVAIGQGGRDLPGGDGEGEVPGRDHRDHADRLAGDVHLHPGAHRGQGLAADAQRLTREELEDVAGAGDLGDGFGQGLAFLARQQLAQLFLARQQLAAGHVQRVGAALRGAQAPLRQGVDGGGNRQFGLVAVGAGELGHHLPCVRWVDADAGGGTTDPAAIDQVPRLLPDLA